MGWGGTRSSSAYLVATVVSITALALSRSRLRSPVVLLAAVANVAACLVETFLLRDAGRGAVSGAFLCMALVALLSAMLLPTLQSTLLIFVNTAGTIMFAYRQAAYTHADVGEVIGPFLGISALALLYAVVHTTIQRRMTHELKARQRTEEALKQSQARLEALLNAVQAGVIVIDRMTHTIVDANPAALRMLGLPRSAVVGSICHKHVCPAERGRCPITDLGQTVDCAERVLLKSEGRGVPIIKTVVPINVEGNELLLESFVDISAQKAVETKLEQARAELEQRVEERTAQLVRLNADLEGEVQERAQAEERVLASLREKEVLLKEIHHRVKNNLQIISSLLSLQATHVQDPQVLGLFNESEHRVRSMALIHEKLYRSHDLARINFREYAEDLLTYLHRSYSDAWGRIQLRVEADDVMLTVESAVPCGLILNELVNNSFKHAFPGGRAGAIVVGIHTNGDGRVHLSVADDGVGLPAGLNLAETTSLGMQLVHTLTEQLGGELSVANGQGASFAVAFAAEEAVEGMPAEA